MTLAKLSVMTLYRRIFPSKDIKIISIILSVVVVAYCVALILVGFLQCIPLNSIWTGRPGTCIDVGTAYLALAYVPLHHTARLLILLANNTTGSSTLLQISSSSPYQSELF